MHPEGLRHLICDTCRWQYPVPLVLAAAAGWIGRVVVLGLLGFIWTAIYDTLQEGDQPPPP